MTTKYVTSILLCLVFLSCQTKESPKFSEMIEDKLNSNDFKQQLSSVGIYGGREIDKIIEIARWGKEEKIDSWSIEEKRQIDILSLKSLVNAKVIDESSGYSKDNVRLTKKKIRITPTEKGEKLLVGETYEKFIFNVFDFEGIKIIKTSEKGDTTLIDFNIEGIKKTEAYEMLTNELKEGIPTEFAFLKKIHSVKIFKDKENYVLKLK